MASRLFFSASSVLGSRPGSVGVGVAGVPGAAWVWRGAAPVSLALALPAGVSPRLAAVSVGAAFPSVSVSVRSFGGRWFLRVRGPRPVLLGVARWFFLPPPPRRPSAWLYPVDLVPPRSPVFSVGVA